MRKPIGVIYGLINGDTMEVRYVGRTMFSAEGRFGGHTAGRNRNRRFDRWIRSTNVNVIVLERNPKHIVTAEARWIRKMLRGGARLLNIQYTWRPIRQWL